MTKDLVVDRLKLAHDADVPEVFYGLYMGLTGETEQVRGAVSVYREFFPRVVGFKLYAGHSVGNLGVIDVEAQKRIYQTLAEEGYDGILAVHCEKESLMDGKVFDRNNPISHSHARPEIAEIESVQDQISFAKHFGFKGKLHIAHISVPDSVALVNAAKNKGLDISCGVCPHHIIYDNNIMLEKEGILYKMNPPLRAPGRNIKMLELLRTGEIDWIETDHAPHTYEDKTGNDCASGLPSLDKWRLFLEFFQSVDFSDDLIRERTHNAPIRRFGVEDIPEHRTDGEVSNAYEFNVWHRLEKQIGW